MRSRPARSARLATLAILSGLALASPSWAGGDGLLGIFFDRDARTCSGDVPLASFATLYVVLVPQGATFGGISAAEFRIDTSGAGGFLFQNETAEPGITPLGSALSGGVTMGFSSCKTGTSYPLLSFQVYNTGTGTTDAVIRVGAKNPPSHEQFACPAAAMCDDSNSMVCIEGGFARLNPASPRPCGSSSIDSEWWRVKELFR